MEAQAVLARVRAAFRAQRRPAFVVYTLTRRDTVDGAPDFANAYALRIWCRTSDGAALARRVAGRAGDMEFVRPRFDEPLDPGPPTADIFEPAAPRRMEATPAPGATDVPRIGSVAVSSDYDYAARYAGTDGNEVHLVLAARRDPRRNRLADLFVDRTTLALKRAVAHDHLYTERGAIPERFEVRFTEVDGVTVLAAIHGRTDFAALAPFERGATRDYQTDYTFTGICFAESLPAWYFEPSTYGAHRRDAPSTALSSERTCE